MQKLILILITDITAVIQTYEPVNELLLTDEKQKLLKLKECVAILTDSENIRKKKKDHIAA